MAYVLSHLKEYMVGGTGLLVYDGYRQCERRMWLKFIFLIEDTRGLPYPMGSKQPPAHIGGCQFCDVCGVTHAGTTCYVGAVGMTTNQALKTRFEEEFKACPNLAALARKKATPMTSQRAVASARRVLDGELEAVEPYKSISVWHTYMGLGWDFVRHTYVRFVPHVVHFVSFCVHFVSF